MKKIEKILIQHWYKQKNYILTCLLLPLSYLFHSVVRLREFYYQCHQKITSKPIKQRPPIVVIGNLTVGGSGKTPLVIATVEYFKKLGYQPAVLSRGYKRKTDYVKIVSINDPIESVGDEPYLIFQKTQVPVVVHRNRILALRHLITNHPHCDLVISDDGLQHYALPRDIEIVVYDEKRRFGNEFLLPMGPLREPLSRLKQVDLIICKAQSSQLPKTQTGNYYNYRYTIQLIAFCNLKTGQFRTIESFQTELCYAVAGIADPESFFKLLTQRGLNFIAKPFSDHHLYQKQDLIFDTAQAILITEKDAVKCKDLNLDNVWVAQVETRVDQGYFEVLGMRIKEVL